MPAASKYNVSSTWISPDKEEDLADEAILPEQWWGVRPARNGAAAIRFAILKQGILHALGQGIRVEDHHPRRKPRRIAEAQAEARAWVFAKDSDYFLSFANLCREFGVEPEWIRQRVRAASTKKRKAA